MEAMATGLPVVTTRIMGIPELVEDGRSGLLVAPGRPEELAAALRRLLEEPGLRPALGAHGRAKVLADFGIAEAVDRLRARFAPAGAPA
jgi:glycosyltransferase involved in cell wall biosynthesis